MKPLILAILLLCSFQASSSQPAINMELIRELKAVGLNFEGWGEFEYYELIRYFKSLEKPNLTENQVIQMKKIFIGKINEIQGFHDFKTSLKWPKKILFAGDHYLSKSISGHRPDGLAYYIEGDNLVIKGVFEAKAGSARYNSKQIEAFLNSIASKGIRLPEGKFETVYIIHNQKRIKLYDALKFGEPVKNLVYLCSNHTPKSSAHIQIISPKYNYYELLQFTNIILSTRWATADKEQIRQVTLEVERSKDWHLEMINNFIRKYERWPTANVSKKNTEEFEVQKYIQNLGGKAAVFKFIETDLQQIPSILFAGNPSHFVSIKDALHIVQSHKYNFIGGMTKLDQSHLYILDATFQNLPYDFISTLLDYQEYLYLKTDVITRFVDRHEGWEGVLNNLAPKYSNDPFILSETNPDRLVEIHNGSSNPFIKMLIFSYREKSDPIGLIKDWIELNKRYPIWDTKDFEEKKIYNLYSLELSREDRLEIKEYFSHSTIKPKQCNNFFTKKSN